MTVEDLIQQQASKNSSSSFVPNEQEKHYSDNPEEDALFRMYHMKGYAHGNGFSIESF